MTQALDTQAGTVADDAPVHFAHEALDRRDSRREARPIERFLSELRRMSPQERVRASRYTFNRWERSVYAARYPDEVPLVNGELEWIALYAE